MIWLALIIVTAAIAFGVHRHTKRIEAAHARELQFMRAASFAVIANVQQQCDVRLAAAETRVRDAHRVAYVEHHDVGLYLHPNGEHSAIEVDRLGSC